MEIKSFSFIIPNYNNSNSIVRCINSILKQNFADFEIIVIDDNSTDDSLEILSKYNNIKVYKNNRNKGVSYSRNIGILEATKKYIIFVDADDYLVDDYKNSIINEIDKKTELYIYNEIELKNNCNKIYSCNIIGKKNLKDVIEKHSPEYLKAPISYWIHNKIFLRDIIIKNNIMFDVNKKAAEDQDFCYKYFKCINNIKFINKELYYYNQINVNKYKYIRYYHQTIKSIYKNNKDIYNKFNINTTAVDIDIQQLFNKMLKRINNSNESKIKKMLYKFLLYITNINIVIKGIVK